MSAGDTFPSESRNFIDAQTGVKIRQLTDYKAHSHHLYFTNPGWYDGGKKLLFGSDRCNRTNLFSLGLESGEITQVTDLEPARADFLFSSLNPLRDEVYFWHERFLVALDLKTLQTRKLYRVPDGYAVNMTNVTADGQYVCTGIYEDLSMRFAVDLLHGYVGFEAYWEAKPHSQIIRINTDDGSAEVVFEEDYWIGHVNTSPKHPHIITYCHEGPWHKVDHRIWGLDMNDGRNWKIRPTEAGDQAGHEYWLADGEHIGYHGHYENGERFYGSIRYDNSEKIESSFSGESMHFHSNNLNFIVGDGGRDHPHLLLWRFQNGQFEGPRQILTHRGTFQVQQLHVHPRFNPDGNHILFTSDMSGYGQLYLAQTPDFDALAT
ncbi:MAG: oligogalacturonide lyase [Anaerolineaceae bacterium]|nr:oligogalacturonide lyase [Anaerolineaceae bacterium]